MIRRGLLRPLAVAALLAVVAAGPVARAENAVSLDAAAREIGSAATSLAKKGRADEVRELIGIVRALGADEKALEKLDAACAKALAKAKKRAPVVKDVSKRLARMALRLAETMKAAESPDDLAHIVLRLDPSVDAAHEQLGHVQYEGRWVPAGMPALLERRAAIRIAVQDARKLEVPIEEAVSDNPALKAAHGEPGFVLRSANVAIHSHGVSRAKVRRVLETAMRARALSQWLRGGELAIPKKPRSTHHFVLIPKPDDYTRAIDECIRNGGLEYSIEQVKRMTAYYDTRGFFVNKEGTEARYESDIVYHMLNYESREVYGGDPHQGLAPGHLNYLCLAFLGRWFPELIPPDRKEPGAAGGAKTGSSAMADPVREAEHLLEKAGLAGSRSWLSYLVEHGEAPAWSAAALRKKSISYVTGTDLLKTTYMVVWLQEQGRLGALMDATVPDENKGADPIALFEEKLGASLGDVEAQWRAWLLADRPARGLVQRLLAASAAGGPSAAEKKLLSYLDAVRLPCIEQNNREYVTPLTLDASLSSGCAAHAEYLDKNPEQKAQWPQAHEEFPDKEGFSVEGSRAGLGSVIAPGVKSGRQAIDAWLGTFYHRLPLLDPGLVRVGWGFEKGTAVLDVVSMVRPWPYETHVIFPAAGATGVPLSFNPELPNPVEGEDQSLWGYPVTVQFIGWAEDFDVEFELFQGAKAGGTPVDCHLSTPSNPTNPRLAPPAAFCLIPKAHLAPGKKYTARVKGIPRVGSVTWTFTTGR